MCTPKPGTRCAGDTREVQQLTARAYYEAFGQGAPSIDPCTNAAELMKDELCDRQRAQVEQMKAALVKLRQQNRHLTDQQFVQVVKHWRASVIANAQADNSRASASRALAFTGAAPPG